MRGCAQKSVFDVEEVESRPGLLVFRVTGPTAEATFRNEPGGHRWQRIPPNDKKGRVHTSTVTVAVMREPTETEVHVSERDLEWSTCRGSGAGGQHRNKTESAVICKHVPSGIAVRCESERSQHQNRRTALGILRARLVQAAEATASAAVGSERRAQVGSGQR